MRWSKSDSSNILAVLHYVGDSVYGEEVGGYVNGIKFDIITKVE